jgi:hypothetical protein
MPMLARSVCALSAVSAAPKQMEEHDQLNALL